MNTETIQVLTAGTVEDPYSGTSEPSWESPPATPPTEVDVTTLAPPEPRPSQEPIQDARNALTWGWTLYLPLTDPPITSDQRVRVRGVVYPVQGEPAVWDTTGQVVQAFTTEG